MNTKIFHKITILLFLLLCTPQLLAQPDIALGPEANDSPWIWNLVIALIVLIFTVASAALPLAAMKQWKGKWSIAAAFPLAVLGAWVTIIVLAKLQSFDSHRLWPFEIFAWSMINMVYMVSIMTIKRILDKDSLSN